MLRIDGRIILPIILGTVFFLPRVGFSADIIPLAEDNVNSVFAPDINVNGEVIYLIGENNFNSNVIYAGTDIMLYDGQGGDPQTLTSGGAYWSPKINDAGQAAWLGNLPDDFDAASSTAKVFFYNGSTIDHFETNFSNGSSTDSSVNINNNGQLVWVNPRDEGRDDKEITFYDGTNLPVQLTSGAVNGGGLESFSPSLSDAGHVAWVTENVESGAETDIYLYHEGATQRITNDAYLDIAPKVNSNGELAWLTISGPNPGVNFYDGSDYLHLGDYTSEDLAQGLYMDLNDLGHVTWNSQGDIFLFNGDQTLRLTNTPDFLESRPSINAAGDIAWDSSNLAQTDSHIELYKDSGITQLDTDASVLDRNPKIADNGDVVWVAGQNPSNPSLIVYDASATPPPPPDDEEPPPPEDAIILPKIIQEQDLQPGNKVNSHLINAISENPLSPEKSTIVIVHGMNEGPTNWAEGMAAAMHERIGDNYNIVLWDWKTEANTNCPKFSANCFNPIEFPMEFFRTENGNGLVLNTAVVEGRFLADALLDGDYTQNIHMIGFSAGGTVIDEAAKQLSAPAFGVDVEQLTFLDSPNLSDTLSRPFDATSANWADNYQSQFGSFTIDGAYDYYLQTPPGGLFARHAYAHEFYQDTIRAPLTGDALKSDVGFFWSLEGGGSDERPSRNSSGGEVTDFFSDVNETIARVVNGNVTTFTVSVEKTYPDLNKIIEDTIYTVDTKFQETFDAAGNWAAEGNVYLQNSIAKLFEGSPAYLFEELTIPEEANFAAFDFKFNNPGDGDYLAAYFDDDLLFWFNGDKFYGDDFWNSSLIDVSPYAGKTGTWTFALDSAGERNAEIWIDNLAFYNVQTTYRVTSSPAPVVPEPSTLALMGMGLLGGVFRSRRRRKVLST